MLYGAGSRQQRLAARQHVGEKDAVLGLYDRDGGGDRVLEEPQEIAAMTRVGNCPAMNPRAAVIACSAGR
jgi:hypothetical protein